MNDLADKALDLVLDFLMLCIVIGLPVMWVLAAIRIGVNLYYGVPINN